MTRQQFGGSEPLDLEAIRQSPRQFVDLETLEKLSDYAMVCELKIERVFEKGNEKMELLKRIFKRETLSDQVRSHCYKIGWPDDAAEIAAKTAVEICESDDSCSQQDLREVLNEVCRTT